MSSPRRHETACLLAGACDGHETKPSGQGSASKRNSTGDAVRRTRRCHLLNCCLLYIYASSQAHREPHRVVRMLRAIPAHRDAALPLLTECASIRLFPSCVISQAASIRGPVPDQLSSQPLPDLQLTEHAAQTSSSSSARSPFRVSPLTQLGILPKPQAASPARQASELLLQRLEVIP